MNRGIVATIDIREDLKNKHRILLLRRAFGTHTRVESLGLAHGSSLTLIALKL